MKWTSVEWMLVRQDFYCAVSPPYMALICHDASDNAYKWSLMTARGGEPLVSVAHGQDRTTLEAMGSVNKALESVDSPLRGVPRINLPIPPLDKE